MTTEQRLMALLQSGLSGSQALDRVDLDVGRRALKRFAEAGWWSSGAPPEIGELTDAGREVSPSDVAAFP